MKFKNNIKARIVALSIILTSPTTVYAGIPTIDFSNLIEAITSNITEITNWAEEKSKIAMNMDLQAMLSKMEMSNTNNAYANMISRINKASQDIYNKEVEEQMRPDSDICKNVATSLYKERTKCYVEDKAKETAYRVNTDRTRYDLNPSQTDVHRERTARKVVSTCNDLTTVDASELTEDEAALYSQCIQAGSLIGAGTVSTLNETEEKAAEMQIRLLTGPIPDVKNSNFMSKNSSSFVRERLSEMRKDAILSLAVSSLSEVVKYRIKPGPGAEMSPLSSYEQFIKDKLSIDSVSRLGGGEISGSSSGEQDNTAYRTELLRKLTIAQLKQTELQLDQFEHQLRLEALNAAMLSIMVNPL